ncbi:MAG TPA: zinc ribbon domain-containing protein, partial [Firmicutes bacterium]|nr:zinc ribbon domain-containing protein [Bacillota bacterium]
MPIYEFMCESCGHKFEELVLGGSSDAMKCPKCGATRTKKLISAFGYSGSSGFRSSSSGSGGCA